MKRGPQYTIQEEKKDKKINPQQLKLNEALREAVNSKNLESVKELIQRGANVNCDENLLLLAIWYNCLDIAQALIQAGAKGQPHLLHHVIKDRKVDALHLLLHYGANPNAKHKGLCHLHLTCKELYGNIENSIEMAKLLLQYGADINALADGMTPLHILCQVIGVEKHRAKFAKFLIEQGANIEILYNGMTALHHAIKKNRNELIQVLIDAGANPNVKYKGSTAIENAFISEKDDIQEILVTSLKRKYSEMGIEKISNAKIVKKISGSLELRLLGHLFNDVDLKGSSLQGATFHETAQYIHDFIMRFLDNKITFQGILPDKEPIMKAHCKDLLGSLTFFMVLDKSTSDGSVSDDLIEKIILEFKQKGRVWIPGGWRGTPGHGMIYEFKIDRCGNCLFLVWNTGSGLENHLYDDTANSRLYYPVKAYSMPPPLGLNTAEFKNYLSLLLEPTYKNKKQEYHQGIIYKTILPKIAFLQGEEIEPIDLQLHKIPGQWSGTCAWQVLMTMIKNYGFQALSPDEFQYEIMQDFISSFVENLTDEDWQQECVALQLQYAIKNFSLFLKKIDTHNDFSKVRREKGLILINKINQKLEKRSIQTPKHRDFEFNANSSISLSPCIDNVENDLFKENDDQQYTPFINYQQLDEMSLEVPDKTVIQAILKEAPENHNAQINLLRRLEHIIFNLPNTQSAWSAITSLEIKEFTNLLTLLAEKYYNTCKTLKYCFAENIIALKICYGLGVMLAKKINPDLYTMYDSSIPENEYFTLTQENHIQGIFKFKMLLSKLPASDFLVEIARENIVLRFEAQEHFETLRHTLKTYRINIEDISEKLIPVIYFYLKRDEKIDQKYPEVEQNFQFMFSILALKNFYEYAISGFSETLNKIQDNKWDLIDLKNNCMSGIGNYKTKPEIDFKLSCIPPGECKVKQDYYFDDKNIAEDLNKKPFENTNEIEVNICANQLSKEIDFRRRLAHIRSYAKSKIIAAIEFVHNNLTQFNIHDLQTCLFLFLFQGDNLSQEIKVNPTAIDALFNCIDKGIAYYQGKKSLFTLLFFYKLNTFLNQFLISKDKNNPQEQYKSWIARSFQVNTSLEVLFNKWINKQNKSDLDVVTLTIISCLQLLHLNNCWTYFGSLSQKEWHLFFVSNCLFSKLPTENINSFVIKEVNKAQDSLRCGVFTTKNYHALILKDIFSLIQVQLDENNITGSFPFYHDEDYGVDLINGVITQMGKEEVLLPAIFYTHPNFKTLISSREIRAWKMNSNAYSFINNNRHYRALKCPNEIIIQQRIHGKWFQLLNKKQLDSFGKSSHTSYSLPLTLFDQTKFVWQAQNGSYVITEQVSGKIQYTYDPESGTIHKLNAKEQPQWILDRARPALDVISKFESSAFTEIWHDMQTNDVMINLPRYALEFNLVPNKTPLQFTCKTHEGYRLALTPPTIKNFEHALVLEPIDSQSGLELVYLIPKQVFIPSEITEDDTYYKLILDIHNEVKSAAYHIKASNSKEGNIGYLFINPVEQYYQNQEQYAIFVQNNGEFKSKNSTDQFYLAYLYFAKRDPRKCYHILNTLVHAISGHEDLTYLRYIITDTPCHLIDKKQAQRCTSNGPEYLAIRLFAFYILIEYLKKGETLKFHHNHNIQGKVNIHAKMFQQEALNKFLDRNEFQSILMKSLFEYLSKEDMISKSMRLKNNQLLTILASLNQENKKSVTQFQAKKKTLRLKQLSKEYHELLNLAKFKLNQTQEFRKKTIETKLAKSHLFAPISAQLENQLCSIAIAELKDESTINWHKDKPTLLIKDLSLKTDDNVLKENILHLYNESKEDDKKAQLLKFLTYKIQTILSDKKKYINKKPSTIVTVLLLKAMLENQHETDELIAKNKKVLISSHFKDTMHTALLQIHQPIKNLNNSFIIDQSSSLNNRNAWLIREIKPVESTTFSINNLKPSKVFNAIDNYSFFASLADEANLDLSMGEIIKLQDQQRNKTYLQYYDETKRSELFVQCDCAIKSKQSILDNLKKEIEYTINAGDFAKDPLLWELNKYNQSVKVLTIEDALRYFAKYHLSIIQTKRHLSSHATVDLVSKIQRYLLEGTAQQKTARIKRKIEEINACQDTFTKNHLIYQLGAIHEQNRCYDPKQFPEILLFEYQDDKLIYGMQYKIILKLLEKNEDREYISKVIQYIMGGGKSKVILPLLARLRPDGTNLTVIEVPPELFETAINDLACASRDLFGQRAFPFQFHRNMQCDAHYFYQLREEFRNIIANKDYILTTKNSMDSLMLKYIDLLTYPQESEDYQKQIKYLDEILNILKNQGDCIADEIDLTLNSKDQLIYTVGEGKPVEKHLLDALVNLYDFLPPTLFSIINGETCRPHEKILDELFSLLTVQLLTSPQSPLFAIVNNPHIEKQQIVDYLQNKISKIPSTFLQLSSQERDLLALYKEELSRLLPVSMKKDCGEHYGLLKDKNRDPLECEVAIPYSGNNAPNKTAKFQNHFLTMNYTIQVQSRKPLSYYLFETFIKNFKAKSEMEETINACCELTTNEIQAEFEKIINITDIRLNDINVDDKAQMKELHRQLRKVKDLKKYCLREFILPSILNNTITLASDPQNHVDMYRSFVGFTGTDFNFRTFHPSIIRDNAESFGTDGQTIHNILNAQYQKTHVMQQDKFDEIFTLIEQHPEKEKVRAIIDCGALFKGIPNREVANKLSYQFSQDTYKNCDIKYILYFNAENKLCAIKTSNTPENEKPIVLGGTEDIDKKLNCTVAQRVTYYPQKQTTGIDIKQAPNTIGFLCLSEHTTLRDLIQSAMRLRDLKGTHFIEFIIMKGLASLHPQIQKWDTIAILNVALYIQTKFLMNCHFTAAMQKIRNVFRSDLLCRLKTEKSINAKIALASLFKNYLYDFDNLSFFDKYGAPETVIKTKKFLKNHKNDMLQRWLDCFKGIQVDDILKNKLNASCQQIIEQALPACEQYQKSKYCYGTENQVITQKETQNQYQQEQQHQVEPGDRKAPVRYVSWEKVNWDQWLPDSSGLIPCYRLNEVLQDKAKLSEWRFSDTLYLSVNFLKTCVGLSSVLNICTKPCYFTLVVIHQAMPLHVLITEREAAEIREILPANKKEMWIETPSGIPYVGNKPKGIEKSGLYQNNVEQLQYFNGDIAYLIGKGAKLEWLKQGYDAKMDFLVDEILRVHPSKADLLPILKRIMEPYIMKLETQSANIPNDILEIKELTKPVVVQFDNINNATQKGSDPKKSWRLLDACSIM